MCAIVRAVDVAMSTKVQDVPERNPGGHLRCSCVLFCDDCSFELVQRYLWVRVCHGVPHLFAQELHCVVTQIL